MRTKSEVECGQPAPADTGAEVVRPNPFAVGAIEAWLEAFHRVRQLRQRILEKPSRVFFYPASRFDWSPLALFPAHCDTFVYSDLGTDPEDFDWEIRRARELDGLRLGPIRPLNLSDLRIDGPAHATGVELTAGQQECYERALQGWAAGEPWARYVSLTQPVGTAVRRLHLYYLCAEGFSTYVHLFTNLRVAPRVICLKSAHDCDKNWTQFLRWESPLGLAVAASGKPEIVVVHRNPQAPTERGDNWPWRNPWQTYEAWEAAAFTG